MADKKSKKNGRDEKGRFLPGNGMGRPKGCLNKQSRESRAYIQNKSPEVLKKVYEQAMEGDTVLLKLLAERMLPKSFGVVGVTGKTPLAIINALFRQLNSGKISTSDVDGLAPLLNAMSKAIEIESFDERLKALERQNGH